MARLLSVAQTNLGRGATEVYEVSEEIPYVKITEIIVSNHSENQASCKISIYKNDTAQEVIIIPGLQLIASQSRIITMATCLNSKDKIVAEPDQPNCIDVLVSCVEM